MHRLLLLPALIGLLLLGSCNSDSETNFHRLALGPTVNGEIRWYADQTTDTLRLVSTDSWHLNLTYTTPADSTRLLFAPRRFDLPAGTAASQSLPLIVRLSPNTLGRTLAGTLTLTAATPVLRPIEVHFFQFPHHNVDYPIAQYDDATESTVFVENYRAADTKAYLRFTLYDRDTPSHRLTSDASWLTVPNSLAQPGPGRHQVTLTMQPNLNLPARTAHLTLTTGSVTTRIAITQRGATTGSGTSSVR